MTFLDAMRRTAAMAGDERGIRFYSDEQNSERRGYAELDERARARAVDLVGRGFGPGDVAVLAFDPGFGFIESVYAALYAGMAIAPVPVAVGRNPRAVIDRLESIVADSGSRLVLTETVGPVAARAGLAARRRGRAARRARSRPRRPTGSLPDDHRRLGRSPAVHLGLDRRAQGRDRHARQPRRQRGGDRRRRRRQTPIPSGSGWLPHYHDMGLIGLLFRPIFAGSDSVLTSPVAVPAPAAVLAATDHAAPRHVHRGPDFAYRLCAQVVTDEQLAELDLSSLRAGRHRCRAGQDRHGPRLRGRASRPPDSTRPSSSRHTAWPRRR